MKTKTLLSLCLGLLAVLPAAAQHRLFVAGDHPKITADRTDDTHLREAGAVAYARLFTGEIARQRIPLAKWLK